MSGMRHWRILVQDCAMPRIAASLRHLAATALLAGFACGAGAQAQSPLPIFDAHLHYNDDAAAAYPLPDVLQRFRAAGVASVLATSRPNDGTRTLVAAAAAAARSVPRVVPFLRPYRNRADRQTWFNDPSIYEFIRTELAREVGYRGIGEFHVFGADAASPWVAKIVALAVERGLWLHAHCDDAALERILAHDPRVKVIWAHSGFSTAPAKIAQYLERHPQLVGELSYRDDVTADGKLTPEWRALFLAHPDRFVVGSDTWINERWERYGAIMADYRGWLAQLPRDVAAKIAYGNGERLFAAEP
jgi:hypothetical protein